MKGLYLFSIAFCASSFIFAQDDRFESSIITNSVALHPMIFDVQKDGEKDIVVVDNYIDKEGNDGENIKSISWFENNGDRGFKRHLIHEINFRSCGIASADIDNDGYVDIIGRYDSDANDVNETGSMFWLKNPYGSKSYDGKGWKKTDIGYSPYSKDICVADFNKDSKMDVAGRGADGKVYVYIQESPSKWRSITIEVPHHDGTDIGDMDNDGDPDIVINGLWIETPADVFKGEWKKHDFAPRWYNMKTGPKGSWFDNNTKVAVTDFNDDGWPDVCIANAENTGYAVVWYEHPGKDISRPWKETQIGYMNYCHTLKIADMDNDGDKDIVCGELIIWNATDPEGYHPVVVFYNRGNNLQWDKRVISEKACYGGAVADIDGDGDIDIVAPRNWNKPPLMLWRNNTNETSGLSSVKITETESQGIKCLKVETKTATYLYDKAGGGFMSMIDAKGNDWISFKTNELGQPGNAASRYRGIPNLGLTGVDNEGGHPGGEVCETKIIAPNVIETTTKSGNWKFRWAFYDSHAKFIVVKIEEKARYWFLYEGVPAGKYDPEKMYWGSNLDGRRNDFPDLLENLGIFNNYEWVYVGQKDYPVVLFLKQLQADDKPDLFSYMGSTSGGSAKSPDGMVCFGFGREHRSQPVLNSENLEFIIGFLPGEVVNATDNLAVKTHIEAVQ